MYGKLTDRNKIRKEKIRNMNKDSKQKSIEGLKTKNAEIYLDIVPVCCFFLILVIFGMCMLKDIAKETEKKA